MRHARHVPFQRDVGTFIVLVTLSVSVMALDRFDEKHSFAGLLTKVFIPFTSLSRNIMNFSFVHRENRLLRAKLVDIARENMSLKEDVRETGRLRFLLGFGESHPHPILSARVIVELEPRAGGGVVLDRGSDAGLGKNMTVIAPEGLVGRIVKVRGGASLVKRVVDGGYRVSALTQRTRATGILGTVTNGRLVMEWVSPNAEIALGDTIVSSGLGSVTPKGIPIGRVMAIRERPESFSLALEVQPFVDFTRLEEVFVIKMVPTDFQALFEDTDR